MVKLPRPYRRSIYARRKVQIQNRLGSLQLLSFTLDMLTDAVKRSFEARRGPLYNALVALNAFALFEIVRSGSVDIETDNDIEDLAWSGLAEDMEFELLEHFNFPAALQHGRNAFGDSKALVYALEPLIAAHVAEVQTRRQSGDMEPKVSLIGWVKGTNEVGRLEALNDFALCSLFFASYAFDRRSSFPELERRLDAMYDQLPPP